MTIADYHFRIANCKLQCTNCLLDIAIVSEPVETKTNSFYHELYMIYVWSVTEVHNDDKTHN